MEAPIQKNVKKIKVENITYLTVKMPKEPSLRAILVRHIMEKGYVPSEQIYKICNELGFKISNGERRLRASESPNIVAVMGKSKRGTPFIQGYKYQAPPKVEPQDRLKELIQSGMI